MVWRLRLLSFGRAEESSKKQHPLVLDSCAGRGDINMSKETYLLLVVFVYFFFMPTLAGAQVFDVSNSSGFQDALDAAQTNGEDDVINVRSDMTITTTLTYYGESEHTLTINGNGHNLDGRGSIQIMNISSTGLGDDTGSHITIQDLTFQNGHSEYNAGGLDVHTNSADITVDGCTFNGNSADWGGGAFLMTDSGTVTLTNNTFNGNSVSSRGGGARVRIDSGKAILTNNTFTGNSADEFGGGVAVYTNTGQAIFTNNTFTDNSGDWGGGAVIRTSSGRATLTNNTFTGNSVNRGGGASYVQIFSDSGVITITNNSFIENSAGYYGGGVDASADEGTFTLTNNIFRGNSSEHTGGGAFVSITSGTATLTNNTFTANSAGLGGGAYLGTTYDQATANIYNNIIWGNVANGGGYDGDELFIYSDGDRNGKGSTINIYNNDLGPNSDFTTGQSEDLWISVADNYDHGGNIMDDPMLVDPAGGNFHLKTGSPCIDAGLNSAPEIPLRDFEGDSRIINSTVDIGADEYIPGPKGDVNGDGEITIVDALLVARHVVGLSVSDFDASAADVNCDGEVNIIDALFIARKAVGLPVTGWCGD